MHMAWVRYTCGRLESRYRYSANIVYNNFPWPVWDPDNAKAQALRQDIERAAQAVLDARAAHQTGDQPASLAVLYASETMPADLRDAHRALDALVDKAYLLSEPAQKARGKRPAFNDTARVALLFDRYQTLVSRLAEAQAQAEAQAAGAGAGASDAA
jgi:hypothetical protein